ncbi:MAG: YigZ family protein [Clostridia bacterium]|nr:YigZ family protein [Clostridia bacterium]
MATPPNQGYRTLSVPSRVRLEARKSVFTGLAAPAASEADALDLLAQARSEFPDASHHVYAWVIGGSMRMQRYSDDGEPQGTAGLPVLDVLRRQSLENAAIVVVRYFGGTLLGTGGLVHAYGRTASLAVREAGPVEMIPAESFRITLGYADYDRFRHQAGRLGYTLREPVFGLDVDIPVLVRAGRSEELVALVADCTSGSGLVLPGPVEYLQEPILLPDDTEPMEES